MRQPWDLPLFLRCPFQDVFKGERRKLVTGPDIELVLELHPWGGGVAKKKKSEIKTCKLEAGREGKKWGICKIKHRVRKVCQGRHSRWSPLQGSSEAYKNPSLASQSHFSFPIPPHFLQAPATSLSDDGRATRPPPRLPQAGKHLL